MKNRIKTYYEYRKKFEDEKSTQNLISYNEYTSSGEFPYSEFVSTATLNGIIDNPAPTSDIYAEFEKLQDEEFKLFLEKSKTYGISNICENNDNDDVTWESLFSLYVRMNDKIKRFKQLLLGESTNDESIEDTLKDLSNYSNIAIIVNKRKWK